MDASDGRSGYDKIPCCFENPAGAEGLPESDIKFPPWRSATDEPGHDQTVSH